MFARFEIIGIFLAAEFVPGMNPPLMRARVMHRWDSKRNGPDVRFICEMVTAMESAIDQVRACRRGDLVVCYGNITTSMTKSYGPVAGLQFSHMQRLLEGYAHHAMGKCKMGDFPTVPPRNNADPKKEFVPP